VSAPPRVALRELVPADAEAMYAYRSDPAVSRYQSWEPAATDDILAFIERLAETQPFTAGTWHQLAIVLRSTGDLIGDCGVHVLGAEPRQAEIGITVAGAHQGRGYARDALGALLELLFGTLRLHRVYGSVDPRNAPSIALLLRAGFRQEAHLRESLWFKDAWADDLIFAMLRSEWSAPGANLGS
jgi:RimJ/RimL family protein N-acetyltransferase